MMATGKDSSSAFDGRFGYGKHGYYARRGTNSGPEQRLQQFVSSLNYSRPQAQNDVEYFSDLLAFAPGMNTRSEDVADVLEQEAQPDPSTRPGTIAPQAARLFASARTGGWRRVHVPANGAAEAFDVVLSGDGRFAYERTLPNGLREIVTCDGTSLHHLYPELGVGARRRVSRFHRAALFALVPFFVPPAEDLARGADLVHVDKNTVDRIPFDAEQVGGIVTRYVFGKDGGLSQVAWRAPGADEPALRLVIDGSKVSLLDADDRVTGEIAFDVAAATSAPKMEPQTDELVVLPMPFRTLAHQQARFELKNMNDSSSWGDETVWAVAASHLCNNQHGLWQLLGNRYLAAGDHRPGLYTLLMASGFHAEPGQNMSLSSNRMARFDPRLSGRDSQIGVYLTGQMKRIAKDRSLGLPELPGARDTFLSELTVQGDLLALWHSGRGRQGDEELIQANVDRALQFVETARSPEAAWAMLGMLWNYGSVQQSIHRDRVTALLPRFDPFPALRYYAQYERIRAMQQEGRNREAREQFRNLFSETLLSGRLPPVDHSFVQAFESGVTDPVRDGFAGFLREQGRTLIASNRRVSALWLALQAHRLGQGPAGDALYMDVVRNVPSEPEEVIRITAVHYQRFVGRPRQALELLRTLLSEDAYSDRAGYWRMYSTIASQAGLQAEALIGIETALDLEYAELPDVVNLQIVRQDHQMLLSRYQTIGAAARAVGAEPPPAFLARIINTADRWRALETDVSQPCRAAALALQAIGADDLAWDYLTTPLAARPNEAQPWAQLAAYIAQTGHPEMAEKAYATAFEIEDSNAQILWDRAGLLQQIGRVDAAMALYRQIATSDWQPRFERLKQQAASLLER